MKVGFWDLETSPHLANVWALFDQNVSLAQLRETSEVICFAWMWEGDSRAKVYSVHRHGKEAMLQKAWDLMNEADAVVSWNGASFDTKTMAKEFFLAEMPPPSPTREIDLMRAAKKRFRLASNKLEYVSKALGLAGKVQHEGFPLWVACAQGDDAAWRRMSRYCRQDVELLVPIFERLKPWISGIPSQAAFSGEEICPACGSEELAPQGFAVLQVGKFQRFCCKACGHWSRSGKRVAAVDIRSIA